MVSCPHRRPAPKPLPSCGNFSQAETGDTVAASDSTQPAGAAKGRSRRALEREKRRAEGKGRPTGLVDALWFLVVFLYGMAWGTWGGVGDAAAGMRSVRISDGTAAGAWLGGWRAVCWSFVPLYLVMIVVAAFDGTSAGGDFDSRFVAADQHSGMAAGLPPVPAPSVPA